MTTTSKKDLITIPGGEFKMGINKDAAEKLVVQIMGTRNPYPRSTFYAEVPEHRVKVKPFGISKHEVTNAEYKEFVDAGGYAQEQWWVELIQAPMHLADEVGFQRVAAFVDRSGKPGPAGWSAGAFPAGQDRHPVEAVSYFEACAYARFRGLRLPTEEEWEFAARGTDGRFYVWGQSMDAWARIAEAQKHGSTAVGSLPDDKSPFGVMDLSRNVSEWVADPFRVYDGSPALVDGVGDPVFGVLRGGMYRSGPDQMRTTFRQRMHRA